MPQRSKREHLLRPLLHGRQGKPVTKLIVLLSQLLSLQIGSFGIILTRRFLLYISMVLVAGLSIWVFVLVEDNMHEAGRKYFRVVAKVCSSTYLGHLMVWLQEGLRCRCVERESEESAESIPKELHGSWCFMDRIRGQSEYGGGWPHGHCFPRRVTTHQDGRGALTGDARGWRRPEHVGTRWEKVQQGNRRAPERRPGAVQLYSVGVGWSEPSSPLAYLCDQKASRAQKCGRPCTLKWQIQGETSRGGAKSCRD